MTDSSHSLLQFFHCLRALLRRAYAVALVTVPTHLMQVGTIIYHGLWTLASKGKEKKTILACISGRIVSISTDCEDCVMGLWDSSLLLGLIKKPILPLETTMVSTQQCPWTLLHAYLTYLTASRGCLLCRRVVSHSQVALLELPDQLPSWNTWPCLQTQEKEVLHWSKYARL